MVKKFVKPFATGGTKTPLPDSTQATGEVSYTEGYGPDYERILSTDPAAKNIERAGQNALFFDITEFCQFTQTGQKFPFDTALSTEIGGYPRGAVVSRTDGNGAWISQAAANISNPETVGTTTWMPAGVVGSTTIAIAATNVTPAPLAAGFPILILTGATTVAVALILPDWKGNWVIDNRTTGTGIITVKTAAGTGVALELNSIIQVVGDGTDIKSMTPAASAAREGTFIQALTNVNVVISATDAKNPIIIFTGVLTANVTVTLPTTKTDWIIDNRTTGLFTVIVKTAAGTGVIASTLVNTSIFCDGTDILEVGSPPTPSTGVSPAQLYFFGQI